MKKQLPMFICFILGLSISVLTQNKQPDNKNLNVTVEFWQQQQDKALEKRKKPTGERPVGLKVPKELGSGEVIKQRRKMEEMAALGYVQPLDFADLAEKRAKGELVELPIATETYLIEVGGNATEDEFSSFSFEDGAKPLTPDSPKFTILKKLANDFDGEKFDLIIPKDRKKMRIRLLRMVNPQAQKILEEIAASYQKKFNRPLRVTSLTRSMDYQIGLSGANYNSFAVANKDSKPPHISGSSFDIARKHLTAEEQNFIMQKLSEMELAGKIDALIEYNANACFHVFAYPDGKPPKME
ncbi:MAG TPA: DUF5715 family protein [Pyrinomonadaceae bacterium]|nr:DUF5715 family protein [Pyrinomonadaceae bacterium]